ncbi:MAG: hypothetical protein A2001_01480 [Treponema sp. GWC1_61_84]|nr:MAG: hypothetical protein A2001_01480 [Treponema sp. GWC1_61_84]
MAGRPPIPTQLKILQGTFRPSREIENPEPKLFTAPPKPPKSLSRKLHPRARAEWMRISPKLVELGLLSEVDIVPLECYCLAYERMRIAEEAIAESEKMATAKGLGVGAGYLMTTPKGFEMQRPEISIAAQARKETLSFLVQFGMTPASRSRVSARKKKTDAVDPMEKILGEA